MKKTPLFAIVCGVLIGACNCMADLHQGLVAYWPLDSTDGSTTPDLSPHGNNLYLVGLSSSDFVPGRRGNCVSLDGQTKYLYRTFYEGEPAGGVPVFPSRRYTISMWVKAVGATQQERTIYSETASTNNNPLFRLSTDNVSSAAVRTNVLSVRIRNNNNNTFIGNTATAFADQGRSTLMPFDGNWHHIVWVEYDGTARLYVDGVLDPRVFTNLRLPEPLDVAAANRGFSFDTVALGATVQQSGASAFFQGMIDEVAIWDRILTEEEIHQVMTNGIPTPIQPRAPSHVEVYPPEGNTNALVGEFFSFQALGCGTHPRTFQWYKDGVKLEDEIQTNEFGEVLSARLIGSTSNILTITNLQLTDSGVYHVVVSNAYGMATSPAVYLVVSLTSPQAPNLTNGQISYWPLDTIEGNSTPDVVRGYDMILVNLGATNLVPGKWGNAFKFYTNGNGLLTRTHAPGDALPITQHREFTISAWIKAPGVNNADGTVTPTGGGRRFFTECRNDATQPTFSLANGDNDSTPRGPVQKLRAFIRNNNNQNNANAGASGIDAYDDTWHHVVYRQRWIGGATPVMVAEWFIDGIKDDPTVIGNQPISPRLPLSAQNTSIGGQNRAGSMSFFFIGLIDDVAVWNRALTEAEIQLLSQGPVPPAPPVIPPLAITSFRADFPRVVKGQSVKLSWVVSRSATIIEIDQGVGNVLPYTTNGIGSIVVSNITEPKTFTLTIRRDTNILTAQTTVGVIDGVASGWSLLDDFEAYPVGPLANPYWADARGGCTIELVAGNRMLNVTPDASSEGQLAILPLSRYAITEGGAATIFARLYVVDDPTSSTFMTYLGVTDKTMRTANDGTGDIGPIARFTEDSNDDLAVGAINGVGGNLDLIPRKLEQGQVYNVWIDVTNGVFTADSTGDAYSIWIQRLGETSRTLIVSNYLTDRDLVEDFLGPTLKVLDKLVVGTRTSSGAIYVDDIYISTGGYNSTVPVAWLGPVPPPLARPTLQVEISPSSDTITFSWDKGALMFAPSLDGPWMVVPDSVGYYYTHTMDRSVPQRYFRIQR